MQLASVLEMLLSVDQEKRREGEQYISQMISCSFQEGADSLLEVMTQPDPQLAHLAALIFKTKYVDSKQALAQLPKQKLTIILNTLQPLINSTKMLIFMKKVCEIIVKIYSYMQGQEQLMALIHTLGTSLIAGETQSMRQAGLYLIQISCESAFDDSIRIGNSSQLIAVINLGLADQNRQVQMAAFKAIIAFLTSIEEEKHMKKFSHLLKDTLSKGTELIKFDQESGVEVFQRLDTLISSHPNFLKPTFQDLLLMFCEIMETPHLEVNLRKIALNCILTLCSHFKTMARKSLYFKTHLIPSYMRVMAEIDHQSLEEWSEQLEEEQMSQDMAVLTVQHLYKLTKEVGNKFIFPLFLPLITEALGSHHPQQQHAALLALTVIVEDCDQSFRTEYRALMKMILPLMPSKHPRVIYALMTAIGYFTSEFTPVIQIEFGLAILEFITQTMMHPIAKLQHKAMLCLQSVIVGLKDYPQIIGSFLSTILGQIYRMYQQSLSTSNLTMMETSLETLSAVTAVKGLGSCSTVFIPKLMQAVSGVSANELKIKKVAIQALGGVLYSLKENIELFDSKCSKIMQTLTALQQKIDPKDPLNTPIMSVYKKVVKVMKNKFKVYSDFIFSRAAQSAVIPIGFHMMDQLDQLKRGQPNEGNLTVKIDLKIDGVKQFVADVSSIQLKMEATNLLKSMSQHMGPSFLKYSEKMVSIISELIRQRRGNQIRHNMISCCKYLVLACSSPQQKHAILQQVDPHLGGALLAAIGNDERETICLIVAAYSKLLKQADCKLFDSIRGKLVSVLATVSRKTKQIKHQYGSRQLDEQQEQQMNERIEEEQQVLEYIKKIMRLAKGDLVFIALEDLFPYEFVLSEHEEQSDEGQESSESS